MNELKPISFYDAILSFARQGYDVMYLDKDPARRERLMILNSLCAFASGGVDCRAPDISGYGMPHYQVLITVNEEDWTAVERKEANMIPGVFNGVKPLTIRITV